MGRIIGSDLGKHSVEVSLAERNAVKELADKNATEVPGTINVVMWPLPILRAMTWRIEELERQIRKLNGG